LKIKEWESEGKPVGQAWVALFGDSIGMVDVDMRIYPVGEGEGCKWISKEFQKGMKTGIFKTTCGLWFAFNSFPLCGPPGRHGQFCDRQEWRGRGTGSARVKIKPNQDLERKEGLVTSVHTQRGTLVLSSKTYLSFVESSCINAS
jgi:hypothetical protein